jgi:hypothetical protein
MLDENRDEIDGAARGTSHGGRGTADETGVDDWRKIDRRMRLLARRRAALDAEEARMLVEAKRAEVHVHLGLGSFIEYMERVLGLAPHAARERLRVAEALEKLPAMREALAGGEVSFSAVRELTRVAKPHNEEDWLVAVHGCTQREVEGARDAQGAARDGSSRLRALPSGATRAGGRARPGDDRL